MENWELWQLSIIMTAVMITICLFLYVYAFIKVATGSKIKFVLIVIALMIVSTIAAECFIISDYALSMAPQSHPDLNSTNTNMTLSSGEHYFLFLGSQAVSGGIRDSTFMVAHWAFAFKYFKSALNMPALFGGKPLTESTNQFLKVFNYIMLSLTCIVPLASCSFLWFGHVLVANGNFNFFDDIN